VGDVWNTGKVNSDEQRYVVFKGKALQSGKTYYWKVKIWDNHQQVSSWSDVAFFTMVSSILPNGKRDGSLMIPQKLPHSPSSENPLSSIKILKMP
jgi:hypothetical protein